MTLLDVTDDDFAASQRVLRKNGFEPVGARVDPVEGELILWRAVLT